MSIFFIYLHAFLYVSYIFDTSIPCLLRSNTAANDSILLRSLKTHPTFILSISNFPCSGNAAVFYQHYNHEKVSNWKFNLENTKGVESISPGCL